jgi:HEAT repeat protein
MRQKTDEGKEIRPDVVTRIQAVSSLPVEDKGRLAQALSRYLTDRSPRVRAAALEVVRDESLREVEPQVLTLLSDRSSSVRYSAVECMGALHEEESIGASWLYPLLNDPVDLVRIEALESLARIGDKGSLSLIVERLEDDDAMVRAYAARSIALLGGRKYVAKIESASKSEQDDNAKAGFAESLFRLGDGDQLQVLLKLLSSPEYLARCASANALSDLPLDQTQLQSALEAVSYAARNALVRGDRSTMERVEKELRER